MVYRIVIYISREGVFMRSLKSHLSLTLALFAILFSVQTCNSTLKIVDKYEYKLQNSYSMIVLSHANIDQKTVAKNVPATQTFIKLSNDAVLDELDQKLTKKQINLLKATLPHFYELKLKHFPKPEEIEHIQDELLTIDGIFQVESFSKRHDQVFDLLIIIKTIIKLFGAIAIITGLLVILKEMRLWQYAHHNRMHIMALFGSPVWLRSAVLFKFAIIDAIIATVITTIVFIVFQDNSYILSFMHSLKLEVTLFEPFFDAFILLAIALATSLFLALALVIQKPKPLH